MTARLVSSLNGFCMRSTAPAFMKTNREPDWLARSHDQKSVFHWAHAPDQFNAIQPRYGASKSTQPLPSCGMRFRKAIAESRAGLMQIFADSCVVRRDRIRAAAARQRRDRESRRVHRIASRQGPEAQLSGRAVHHDASKGRPCLDRIRRLADV